VYPDPSAPKGSSSGSSKENQADSPDSSAEDNDDDAERDVKLESIPDEDEPQEQSPRATPPHTSLRRGSIGSALNFARTSTRHSSETPSLEGNKSSSPSVSTGTSAGMATPFYSTDLSTRPGPMEWAHLPSDLRFYLDYFHENLTHYSYCMVLDIDDLCRTFLPSTAIRIGNEALLYAVVGFSAYHYTMQNPNGQIQDFLQYYNKSVTLLLSSFKKREKQNIATLLTILQLATIEVGSPRPADSDSRMMKPY
jgi:hypothetical protein